MRDEEAVKRAVQNTVKWVVKEKRYTNVLLEIDNECDVRAYDHEILKPGRVPELILLPKETSLTPAGWHELQRRQHSNLELL